MTTWNALRPVFQLFTRSSHRRQLLTGMLLAVATVLFGMALLGLSGWFLTACYVAGLSAATALVFDVFAPGAGVRLLSILRTAARYGERVTTHDATLRVLAELRVRLFSRFSASDIALRLRQRPARLLYRLTSDIDALDAVYLRLFTPAVALLASTVATALALGLFLDWRSGLLVGALVLAGGVACIAWCVRQGFATAIRRSFAGQHLRAAVIDMTGGQTELVMAGRLYHQLQQVLAAERQQMAADIRLNRIEAQMGVAIAMIGHLATATALLSAGWLVLQGQIGAPIAALATLVLLAALEPLLNIRRGAMEAGRTLLAARRLAPQLQAETAPAAPLLPVTGLVVDLQDASVQYNGCAQTTLKNVDLQVADGEWLVLAGPSGTGKSSLLGLMAGEVHTPTGKILHLPAASLPQRTELFHDSIAGNLRLARPDASDDALWKALQAAGLAAVVAALPQQLATPLGSQGAGLSGGESRRLALARLLLHPAPLTLLDEPTEGLDRRTADQVMQAITDWRAARRANAPGKPSAVVMASHLQREARHADRIVWVDPTRSTWRDARKGTPEFDALIARLRPG